MAPLLLENENLPGHGSSSSKSSKTANIAVLSVDDCRKDDAWIPKTEDDHAVLAVRNLTLDMTMQNGGGHGGSAVGMAAIGVALWKHTMRYNPCNPEWFDRDRFVLSNGW